MQGSKNQDRQLPKIRSQKRIYTTGDRRSTEEDKALTNRPLSNNGRARSLKNFTSKTVKYQTTGNFYSKKVEQLEKQQFIVEKQYKQAQQQIANLRQTIGTAKRDGGTSRLQQSSMSFASKISNRKINLADDESIKGELRNLEAKILNSRNKIDIHIQKNKAIQKEIDIYRKEISTSKGINQQLQNSFKKTSQLFFQHLQMSKKLELQIAFKNQLTHRKKVDNLHQKANMIKQYDTILKTLDRQLNIQKNNQGESRANFYLTGVNTHIDSQVVNSKENSQFRSKRPKISNIREKLKNYEKQFAQLKEKVGSQNLEDITKKFTEEYQNNFHQYKFINETYQIYEQANLEQFQLLQKKAQLIKQIQAQKSNCKVKEIHELRSKTQQYIAKKQKAKESISLYNKISLQLKVYIGQYLQSIQMDKQKKDKMIEDISDKTITEHLHRIYQMNMDSLKFNGGSDNRHKINKNLSLTGKDQIEQMLEEARHDTQCNSRQNKLLTRQEFEKTTANLRQNSFHSKFKNKRDIQKHRSNVGLLAKK